MLGPAGERIRLWGEWSHLWPTWSLSNRCLLAWPKVRAQHRGSPRQCGPWVSTTMLRSLPWQDFSDENNRELLNFIGFMTLGLCDYGPNGVYWGLAEEFNVVTDAAAECEVYVEFVNVTKLDSDLHLFHLHCRDHCDLPHGHAVFVSSIQQCKTLRLYKQKTKFSVIHLETD